MAPEEILIREIRFILFLVSSSSIDVSEIGDENS